MTLTLPLAVKANEQGLPERCGHGHCLCVCVCESAPASALSLPPSSLCSGSYCMD